MGRVFDCARWQQCRANAMARGRRRVIAAGGASPAGAFGGGRAGRGGSLRSAKAHTGRNRRFSGHETREKSCRRGSQPAVRLGQRVKKFGEYSHTVMQLGVWWGANVGRGIRRGRRGSVAQAGGGQKAMDCVRERLSVTLRCLCSNNSRDCRKQADTPQGATEWGLRANGRGRGRHAVGRIRGEEETNFLGLPGLCTLSTQETPRIEGLCRGGSSGGILNIGIKDSNRLERDSRARQQTNKNGGGSMRE
jgi:hypothetical protein